MPRRARRSHAPTGRRRSRHSDAGSLRLCGGCAPTPTKAQTRGCAHERGASHPTDVRQLHPDDGALQCTSTSWKCVRSPAHHNTEGPSVECARRVACRKPDSSRATSVPSSNGPRPTRSGNHSMNTHAQTTITHRVERLLHRYCVEPMRNREGRQEANCKAVRFGRGATATGGADDRESEAQIRRGTDAAFPLARCQ